MDFIDSQPCLSGNLDDHVRTNYCTNSVLHSCEISTFLPWVCGVFLHNLQWL